MRKLMIGVSALVLFVMTGLCVQAQEVTAEDVENYAVIELAKNSIVAGISPMVNDLISKQEGMTGQRFTELQATKGDAAKLAEIKALEWETKFLTMVNDQIEKRKDAAKEVVNLLANNAMGADKYKATKAALAANADLKAKYDGYLAAFAQ
ncbi:MAG: hypothetical protein U5K79_09995 [Cyclobacteriaceae bacterium]|nr:hypothetical protein [Cyclobacteriaceae bacterium]